VLSRYSSEEKERKEESEKEEEKEMIQIAVATKAAALGAEAVAIICLGTVLIVAKEKGYDIPEELLKDMRRWFEYEA